METGVSYFSGRDLRHARADLADMVAHRCTYVVHCLTETDLVYNIQGMAEIVRASRDLGLEPWADPWGVCGIFSGESFSRFLVDHPESWQLRSDGRAVPALGWEGAQPRNGERSFAGFRLYASTLADVAELERALRAQGIDARTNAADTKSLSFASCVAISRLAFRASALLCSASACCGTTLSCRS